MYFLFAFPTSAETVPMVSVFLFLYAKVAILSTVKNFLSAFLKTHLYKRSLKYYFVDSLSKGGFV